MRRLNQVYLLLFALVLFYCRIPSLTGNGFPLFSYYENSLYLEVKEAHFNITIPQGIHVLVMDNTGHASGEFNNRHTSAIDYTITLPEEQKVISNYSLKGFFALETNSWFKDGFILNKSTNVVQVDVSATSPISLFITSVSGAEAYDSEVIYGDMPTGRGPQIDPGLALVLGMLMLGVVGIIIFLYRRKRVPDVKVSSAGTNHFDRFWNCPKDQTLLQIRHRISYAQNPQFTITRNNMEVGINNAIAMKKIPPEAATHTRNIVELLFRLQPNRKEVEMVSVFCRTCGIILSAPRDQKPLDTTLEAS